MGSTRRITIEVSEAAASALEADPERARAAGELLSRAIEGAPVSALRALLARRDWPDLPPDEVEAALAEWNAESRR